MTKPFPTMDDLLLTVRDFLNDMRGELSPERRYQAQVAAFLLDVARREHHATPPAEAITDLAAFQNAIRAGKFDAEESELAEKLLQLSAAEMQIVRPDLLAANPPTGAPS
jgi:hypothetical protein